MASGIICQSCGIEAPTRHVDFHQNIGMLVMRTHRKINAMLCKKCVHKHFWKMTGTTLLLGPWGTLSAIIAPCFILNNTFRYLGLLRMPAVPPNAAVPLLDAKAISQIQSLQGKLIEMLNTGQPIDTVAVDIAAQAKVTPGQVLKYVIALAQQNRPAAAPPPTRGFPVQPLKPIPVVSLDAQNTPISASDQKVLPSIEPELGI